VRWRELMKIVLRTNISQGGYGKQYNLDEEIINIGYKIMEKCDLQIFAFDLLLKIVSILFV